MERLQIVIELIGFVSLGFLIWFVKAHITKRVERHAQQYGEIDAKVERLPDLKRIETALKESQAQVELQFKAAIAQAEAMAKAGITENIRRAGRFYDDRYAAIKSLFTALERFYSAVLSLQVYLYHHDNESNGSEDSIIAEKFAKIKEARDECSKIVEQNGFLIWDSLRKEVTECQQALNEIVSIFMLAYQAKDQGDEMPPQPDYQAVGDRIVYIRYICWKELGIVPDEN
jgi:hypothetical protein